MKIINEKSWIKGKWIENQTPTEQTMEKYYDIFLSLLHRKKVMVLSYALSKENLTSKAVYINFTNDKEIWINTDESAEFCQYLHSNKDAAGFIFDEEAVCGAMLIGEAEFEQRPEYITKSWKEEFNDWYPGGMYGGDFKVVRFTIQKIKVFYDSKEVLIDIT